MLSKPRFLSQTMVPTVEEGGKQDCSPWSPASKDAEWRGCLSRGSLCPESKLLPTSHPDPKEKEGNSCLPWKPLVIPSTGAARLNTARARNWWLGEGKAGKSCDPWPHWGPEQPRARRKPEVGRAEADPGQDQPSR